MKSLQVRMYNVGFGDCFLLTLPGKRTVLIDAGFHSQGKGAFGGNDLAEQIIQDVTEVCGKARIDVVIATHRHQDHIYAFNSPKWEEVEIGEVWLPWVEDRSNVEAVKLWKKKDAFAVSLAEALPTFGLSPADQESVRFMLWNAGVEFPGVPGLVGVGGWSNAGALDCLHEGFSRRDRIKPRFLPATQTFPESFQSGVLPDVTVHVLGPPRDADLIEELDPQADGETYRALALRSAVASGVVVAAPFGESWQVPDNEAGPMLEGDEITRINDLAKSADAVFAAEKVDGMINSTSLVLVLQVGDARLLLPGDAEWGIWKRILADETCRGLIHGSTFFKVGHHGSHNATSKTLVEKVLPRGIPAMVSTQQGPGKYRNNIPLGDLMDALTHHNIHFVRSDRSQEHLPQGFEKGDQAKWIDVELPC